jgi:hypothetical protein
VKVGGATLRTLVDTNVIVVIWPPGKVLVAVVNTLDVVRNAEPEKPDGAPVGGMTEALSRVDTPSKNVVGGSKGPVGSVTEMALEDMRERDPVRKVKIVLVKAVVCPPGTVLVTTSVVLDGTAETSVVDRLENEGAVAAGALVN